MEKSAESALDTAILKEVFFAMEVCWMVITKKVQQREPK
jgi:hypothetical protein